ncbi:MAG TPA: M28 family peptidase [Gemmatirosa sp.]
MLRTAGYDVAEVAFTYSDAPGRFGTPVIGVAAALTLGVAAAAGTRGRAGVAAAVLAVGGATLAAAGAWVGRFGTRRISWRRRDGVNLVATRAASPAARAARAADGLASELANAFPDALPGAEVRVWLVAHLDTKSQPVAMVARVAGVVATLAVTGVAAIAAALGVATGRDVIGAPAWFAIGVLGVVSAVPIIATTVGSDSDGALDNASGVAAILGAAEALAGAEGVVGVVGVLLTSAEELGLAGAHAWADAWARAGRAPGIAFNCDGVDDAGPLTVLRGARVSSVIARALAAAGDHSPVHVRRIPPGLLVDAVALAAAGWGAVTVSKGTWGTLARVHTARDTLAQLRGEGVAGAAELLARLARGVAGTGAE